jgi:hypothetical protein
MTMNGGKISQPDAGDTLTVDGLFNWGAGVLNTSAVLSTVTLQGGGTFTGGSGSLTTGSNLVIPSAVNSNLQGTGLYFNNNAGITIQNTGQLTASSPATLYTNGSGIIDNSGTFSVNYTVGGGSTPPVTSQLPFHNNAGSTLQVVSGTFNVTGSDASGIGISQSGGRTIIYASNANYLQASSGYQMSGGFLYTYGAGTGNLWANVTISGGEIDLNANNPTSVGILNIEGYLSLNAGTYVAKVNASMPGVSDCIQAGNISISNPATLTVTTFNYPQGGIPNGRRYTILQVFGSSTITGNPDFGTRNLAYNGGQWVPGITNVRNQGGTYTLTAQNS